MWERLNFSIEMLILYSLHNMINTTFMLLEFKRALHCTKVCLVWIPNISTSKVWTHSFGLSLWTNFACTFCGVYI